ncbi:MAG TPA: type II toxin-antitoxin system RelE/ParE family toxin [Dehalococcoidia bacterium]|nr:type II toxin-antitoxin system RelE/ParE family toxin [Dehalococcoidia bacterium]
MSYQIRIKPSAEEEMRNLPRNLLRRVHRRIEMLGEDPYARGIKKLVGGLGFRAAVGAYRIVYTIDDDSRVVEIVAVRHRREVYR